MKPIRDKRIILGVTGSIAAYKAAELASRLTQAGAWVDAVLTPAALQFITPLTFQSVSGRRSYVDADLWGAEGHIQHIGLARGADLLLIAPVSANTIARLAHGLADNLLTLTALAASCPMMLAPAMDGGMFEHPATQQNLNTLHQRGAVIVGPVEGHLASGLTGKGRMVEPVDLLGLVRYQLSRTGPLSGEKVVVTAGGTQEPIDPVRVIANRSSGKQGFALAQAALDLGAEVILISAPTALETPAGARRVDVRTADEMLAAVMDSLPGSSALLMAAAVADFRSTNVVNQKLKKGKDIPVLDLEHTPDILKKVAEFKAVQGWPKVTVGFAAESQSLLENARQKLESKRLDLIAANDISASDAGFASDSNRITLLGRKNQPESLPLMSKIEAAEIIMDRVTELLKDL